MHKITKIIKIIYFFSILVFFYVTITNNVYAEKIEVWTIPKGVGTTQDAGLIDGQMWRGRLKDLLAVNDLDTFYESHYKNLVNYLIEKQAIPADSSEEYIKEYIRKNANSIEVWTTTIGYLGVSNSMLPPINSEENPQLNVSISENINTEDYRPSEKINSDKLNSMVQRIIGIIQVVGTVLSVIIITIIGLRYITGSVEERAEYKTTATLYIIGAILLFCTVTIVKLAYNITSGLFD